MDTAAVTNLFIQRRSFPEQCHTVSNQISLEVRNHRFPQKTMWSRVSNPAADTGEVSGLMIGLDTTISGH